MVGVLTIDDIYTFLQIEQQLAREHCYPQMDIGTELGIDGDDFVELMQAFAQAFDVDMSAYRWYFHHAEEGLGLGALFGQTLDAKVKRIAITPQDLLHAAQAKYWTLNYPQHHL